MKFPAFAYAAPTTVDEAVALLAEDEDARPLAGGQSLLPIMALRMAAPSLLVDLGAIASLREVRDGPQSVRIGAMVTHAANARSAAVRDRLPLVGDALHFVAHQAVRNRGTFGGSLAHADPGAEMPVVVTALGGTMLVVGAGGERSVAPEEFFQGLYTTAVGQGELLVAVDLPVSPLRWTFDEVARRAGDLAMAMVAVGVRDDDNGCAEARIVLGGVSDRPCRAPAAEAYLSGRALTEDVAREAGRLAAADLDARSDHHANAALRRSMAAALVRRSLLRLAAGDP